MFNLISNNEKSFIIRRLEEEGGPSREDNRTLDSYRPISIKKLHSNGQVEVTIGKTIVISQIYAKLTSPFPDRPNEGIALFSIDTYHIKPNADYNRENESLNEFRTKINNFLQKSLRESKALDMNSLCIIPGKVVWKIVVDINIINYDGNAIDACLLATIASWQSYRIPFLRKKDDKVINNGMYIYLTMLHSPFSVSFGIYNYQQKKIKFICDPTWKEEQIIQGTVTVSSNIFGEICFMQMISSLQVGEEDIQEMLMCAHEKVKELHRKLKEFLEEEKRNLENNKNKREEDVEMKEETEINGNWKFMEKINATSRFSYRKYFDVLTYQLEQK